MPLRALWVVFSERSKFHFARLTRSYPPDMQVPLPRPVTACCTRLRCFFHPTFHAKSPKPIFGDFNGFPPDSGRRSIHSDRFSVFFNQFQSVSISFNQFQSVSICQKRRNLLTTGRWGKQHVTRLVLAQSSPVLARPLPGLISSYLWHRVNGVGQGGGQADFNQILTRFYGIRLKSG